MGFKWDEGKRVENLYKRGVDFPAIELLGWDNAVVVPAPVMVRLAGLLTGILENTFMLQCTLSAAAQSELSVYEG